MVKKYVQLLCQEITNLEGKVFEIEGLKVTLKFEEVPNDMKMVAMLGGELSNSAKFFSSFANVSKENCSDLKGTFATNCRTCGILGNMKKELQLLTKLTNLSSLCRQNNSKTSNFELR